MKNGTLIGTACGALVVGALWTGTHTLAQEGMEEMSPDDMMAAWAAMHEPGEHHKMLEHFAGEFTAVAEFKMDPNAPPMVSEATQSSKLVFDGRYLKSKYDSDFMGDPFTGVGYMGYDNQKKEFNAFWIDSMSTGMFMSSGQCNDAGDEWTMFGQQIGPMGETVKAKHVYTITDNGYTMAFFKETPDGWNQEGTITYTRK